MRTLNLFATAAVIALPFVSWAQPRASACFFSADFESGNALDGWDLGAQVERRTPEGTGLGEFVNAWTLGDAAAANVAQYFPVVDQPMGNRFVMANDAAPPCNCAMDDLLLTSPTIDLTGRTGVALECRVFNEGTLGAGQARIDVNVEGDTWITVKEIAAVEGAWQPVLVDLSAYDNIAALRLRFRWSDGGNWAGGFAVDDVCLRVRQPNDITVSRVMVGDATVSPFTTGDQSLHYRQLPLTQAGALHLTAEVKNSGTNILRNIQVDASLDMNGNGHGPFLAAVIDSLMPGNTAYAPIATGWTPAEAGTVHFTANAVHAAVDDDSSDDSVSGELQMTAPGWDDGYSAMSCDNGIAAGSVGGNGSFMVANRMEMMYPGSQAHGVSVSFSASTHVGEVVRAVLMDGNFSFIDTSMRRTISEADLIAIGNGEPLYFSLSNTPQLAATDVWVAIQHLPADDQHVAVRVGGEAPVGRSVIMEGTGFTLTYLRTTPMVRLHLSHVVVAVDEHGAEPSEALRAYPVPANDMVYTVGPTKMTGAVRWSILDSAGRTVKSGTQATQHSAQPLGIGVADLVGGVYVLAVQDQSMERSVRFVVAH